MKTVNALGLACICSLLTGCAGFFDFFRASDAPTAQSAADAERDAADARAVREVVDYIRSVGASDEISSQAMHLPSNLYDSITRYQHQFPASCGGQVFRLYESMDTQILEYEYVPASGPSYVIRDYAAGPSPFITAGLWSAYDHTRGGVDKMQIQFEKRGSGILSGTYSRGPVTGLDEPRQQELEGAYVAALQSVKPCVTAQARK